MPKTISHGLTTAQPDNPAYDVSSDEINQHTESYSGLTAGHVMRASAATAADFAAIQDGDLPATIARDSEVTAALAAQEFADLADVDMTGLGNGDGLIWDSGSGVWLPDDSASGLPPQWSDGGNGDVTAATDNPTKTPLTIQATLAQEVAHKNLLVINNDVGDPSFFVELESNASQTVHTGGQMKLGIPVGGNVDRPRMEYEFDEVAGDDASSTFIIYGGDATSFAGFEGFTDHTDSDNNYMTLQIRQPTGQDNSGEPAVRIDGPGTSTPVFKVLPNGAPVTSQNSAPADGDLSATDGSLWFDSANGAAYFMFKGKTVDGTVVTGKVRLGHTVQTYSESNVTTDRTFNANATSIDELADVLGTLIADLRAQGLVA